MFIKLDNLKMSTKPVCSKYKITGLVEGFYTKDEISKLLNEHNIDADLDTLEEKSDDVLVWKLSRLEARSHAHVYVGVNGNIIESKITIRPHLTDVEICDENISGTTRFKLEEDIKDIFCGSNAHINELNLMSTSFEAKTRSAIAMEIGDVIIFCDDIEYVEKNGIKESIIPIGLGNTKDKSPIVLATVIERDGKIDISDVENKVSHLLIYEGHGTFGRIKEKLRRKIDLNNRKEKHDNSTLDKTKVVGKDNLKQKVVPNRGREELSEDESEEPEYSDRTGD